MIKFNHFNFNVLNLEKSLDFYEKALDFRTDPSSWFIWGTEFPSLPWS